MDAFLLTWNPKHFEYDTLVDEVDALRSDRIVSRRWSTGGRKMIQPGDRIFLLRLGLNPKGIFGFGIASSEVYRDVHWSGDAQRSTNYVMFDVRILLNPDVSPILDLNTLRSACPGFGWTPQGSGVLIPPNLADDLQLRLEQIAVDAHR